MSAYVLELEKLPGGLPNTTYLVLDHACGEFAEFPHDSEAFEVLLEGLGSYLPLPNGWAEAVRSLQPGGGLDLFVRDQGHARGGLEQGEVDDLP